MPEFDVPDMTCDGCAKAITGAVQRALPGAAVAVDLAAKRVQVTGTEAAAQAEAAMRDAGFTPRLRASGLNAPGLNARIAAIALAFGLLAGPAFAQTAPAAPAPSNPPAAPPTTQAAPATPATPAAPAPRAKPMPGHAQHDGQRTSPAGKPTPATKEYRKEMRDMHRGMAVIYTNDADRDFAALMIPHHQGAIEMAKTLLKYGKDPELRALAQSVVDAQEKEIALMRAWQAKQPK